MTFYLAILYVVPFIAFLGKIFARKQALRFNSDGSLIQVLIYLSMAE